MDRLDALKGGMDRPDALKGRMDRPDALKGGMDRPHALKGRMQESCEPTPAAEHFLSPLPPNLSPLPPLLSLLIFSSSCFSPFSSFSASLSSSSFVKITNQLSLDQFFHIL